MPPRTQLVAPTVSDPDLPDALAPGEAWENGLTQSDAIWENGHGNLTAQRAQFEASVVRNCTFENVNLAYADLLDIAMDDVSATSLQLNGAHLRRVSLKRGRIASINLAEATVDELQIVGMRIDYLSFAGAKLTDIELIDCQIGAIDLPGATVTRFAGTASSIGEFDSRDARMQHVDLRGFDIQRFLHPASLRGATITAHQAAYASTPFATALGLHIVG